MKGTRFYGRGGYHGKEFTRFHAKEQPTRLNKNELTVVFLGLCNVHCYYFWVQIGFMRKINLSSLSHPPSSGSGARSSIALILEASSLSDILDAVC